MDKQLEMNFAEHQEDEDTGGWRCFSASHRVSLLSAMDSLEAMAMLIFTKNTRLKMNPGGLRTYKAMVEDDPEWAMAQLDYMSKTIRSSWEFIDFTFMIENVSRACAQQITRTRTASFAMQSQRVTDMSEATVTLPDEWDQIGTFEKAYEDAFENYRMLVASGAKLEDARGVLPMNIQCNLVMKLNMRTLVDLLHARSSDRAQGEYRMVAEQMRKEVENLYPWFHLFMRTPNDIAISLIDEAKAKVSDKETSTLLSKAIDALKK